MRILLSAGHGAGQAHNRGGLLFNEGDNNFNYSLILKKHLENYEGVTVDLVRIRITDNPSLAERSAMGRGYDLYLDIHSNAPGSSDASIRGTEIWDSVERPNRSLANKLVEATARAFNHNNRGVKYKEGQVGYNWFGVLRFNQAASAMIIEHGFHTNMEDSRYFLNNQEQLAEIQARVIAEHYGLKKKQPVHWGEKHWQSLNNKGVKIHERRFNDTITRAEVFALLDRIVK